MRISPQLNTHGWYPVKGYHPHIYLILALFAIACGCRLDNDTPEEPSPFEIIVISDTHVRLPGNTDDTHYDNQKNLTNLTQTINMINGNHSDADFLAITGDLVGCLFSEDPKDYQGHDDNPAERFKSIFDPLTLPYHVALGNHDYHIGFDPLTGEHIPSLNPEAVEAVWKKVLGTDPYYAFIHKGVQMIFLNSNRGHTMFIPCNGLETETRCLGSFDQEQMDWLESRLDRPEPAILFCHHPPQVDMDAAGSSFWTSFFSQSMTIDIEERFYDIAASHQDKILAMFVGHWHLGLEYTLFDTIKVYHTGSIGDFWDDENNISIVKIDPVLKTIDVSRPPETESH